ncbi:MAG: M50 family metallopeptidase [Chloroflexota bacterium]
MNEMPTLSENKLSVDQAVSRRSIYWLIAFGLMTVAIWNVPGGLLILYPFTILGTWFHELSHGLMALFNGGDFLRLDIYSDGSGVATFAGSMWLGNISYGLIAAAGPLGPTAAGWFLLRSSVWNRNGRALALLLLSLALFVSALLWIRAPFGFFVVVAFGFITLLIATKARASVQSVTLQFLGVQAFVSVYMSVGYLFSEGAAVGGAVHFSDTQQIENNLLLPHWFWAIAIIIISIFAIYRSVKYVVTPRRKSA